MAHLINGSAIADSIHLNTQAAIQQFKSQGKKPPGLVVILIGNDPASEVYVNKKRLACEKVGIFSILEHLEADIEEFKLIELIEAYNQDNRIDGILVQLPLPPHLNADTVIKTINPRKDVDGLHPYNIGLLALRQPGIRPCTPKGIMALLASTQIDLIGKEAVIVGASNIVGRPMALELMLAGCTVTVCHKFSKNTEQHVKRAELLVVAVGKPQLIPGDWIKPGAIVIDVGINRSSETNKLIGDVDFESARSKAGWITPVPGGVGPMTVAMLLQNTLEAATQTTEAP